MIQARTMIDSTIAISYIPNDATQKTERIELNQDVNFKGTRTSNQLETKFSYNYWQLLDKRHLNDEKYSYEKLITQIKNAMSSPERASQM